MRFIKLYQISLSGLLAYLAVLAVATNPLLNTRRLIPQKFGEGAARRQLSRACRPCLSVPAVTCQGIFL